MSVAQAGELGQMEGMAGIVVGAIGGLLLAGPWGMLAGILYGVVKAYKSYQVALAKQAEFLAFEKLGKSADAAVKP